VHGGGDDLPECTKGEAVAPIEVFFGVIVFIFALIGLVRGFLRELGVTLVLVFLLFFLSLLEERLDTGLVRVLDRGSRVLAVESPDLVKCCLFVLVVIAAAFVSYQGETLAFAGQPPRGPQGVVLGLLTGSLNGYLIAGSVWFYLAKYNYPIRWMGFSQGALSNTARTMMDFLPIPFLGKPILFGQSLLLYLCGLLILARVIR